MINISMAVANSIDFETSSGMLIKVKLAKMHQKMKSWTVFESAVIFLMPYLIFFLNENIYRLVHNAYANA